MHAVNVRQLKSNPSVALREAKTDLAASLFRSGDISAATAAKVAQEPLADMLALLSRMGIPLYGGSPADAVEEMDRGAAWLAPTR